MGKRKHRALDNTLRDTLVEIELKPVCALLQNRTFPTTLYYILYVHDQ